jgi:phosphoenolpyruvate synthase/pyruvate phosphate dikinase
MGSLLPDRPGRLISLDDPLAARAALAGGKAAALARARQRGLPVPGGYVTQAGEGAAALRAGCAALRTYGRPAARRAALAVPVDHELAAELAQAVAELGGRVIVRSSSALESDPRWSGAFSSLTEIGAEDVGVAARSCWASAFAPDPLDRLARCGLDPARLGLSLLIQPELAPEFGGLARVLGGEVSVTWVTGHPGALLAGAADGDSARVGRGVQSPRGTSGAMDRATLSDVAGLARTVHELFGDDVIEWASCGGRIFLLQTASGRPGRPAAVPAAPDLGKGVTRIAGRSCVPGDAAGRLRYVAPHQAGAGQAGPPDCGHILVCERPLASLAPLLFGARGVVCQSGPGDSHLAGVARALGVPMLVQVRIAGIISPLASINEGNGWLAVISGRQAELAVVPAESGEPLDSNGALRAFLTSAARSA